MKVYLTRHGQCNSNIKKIYNFKDEDINDEGILQANSLASNIATIDYDVIFSSPLLRAVHTAEIINVKNKKIILDERLEERHHGSLEGMPLESTDREKSWDYFNETKYADEESVMELFKRVWEFLDYLKTQNYQSIIVVAHSGVSKALYAYFNGIPEDGRFLNLGIKNTEVKEYIL